MKMPLCGMIGKCSIRLLKDGTFIDGFEIVRWYTPRKLKVTDGKVFHTLTRDDVRVEDSNALSKTH